MMPLGELDVQDVKEHLKKQKQSEQEDYGEGNDFVLGPGASSSSHVNTQLQMGIADMNKRRETREDRLGLR